jgi:hypothetical protein
MNNQEFSFALLGHWKCRATGKRVKSCYRPNRKETTRAPDENVELN